MPELPDVEAMRHYLVSQGLVGRAFAGVELIWPGAVKAPSVEKFLQTIGGRQIEEISRRAKFLLFQLDAGLSLIVHLRMTGSLLVEDASVPRHPMTRNLFMLDDGRELRFVDPRKLGMLWLVEEPSKVLGGLGPEPLEPGFTPDVLAQRLEGRNVPIKALLCEQSVVAWLGNIYADEVLFAATVHPLRRAYELSSSDMERVHWAIIKVLTEATEKLALLPMTGPFRYAESPLTESKEGRQVLMLSRDKGAICPRCTTALQRVPVRGRSSYFCPSCQS